VLNLLLLSLMLDFGLYDEYAKLLNIPFMKDLQHEADTKELQVEVSRSFLLLRAVVRPVLSFSVAPLIHI
jgi:hypothetical protein